MGSFGERLQREREMRGVTLDEIAESTKISARSLRAIEEGHFDQLPGGIFNKGFVRAYARYLGIDEDQAVADFLAAEEAHRADKAGKVAEIVAQAESQVPYEPRNRTWLAVAVALALLALGLAGWNYWQKRSAVPDSVTSEAVQAAPPLKREAPAVQPDAAAPPQSTPAQPEPAAASSTPTAAAAAPGEFMITLRAQSESWVSVTADGKLALERVMAPQEERRLTAHERVIITNGNPGGIQISFNGQPQSLPELAPGRKSQTLTFTSQGLQR